MRRHPLLPSTVLPFFLLASGSSLDAATLRGQVRDPDGRAVPAARVLVSGPLPRPISVVSDDAGRFEIASLGPGRHEVRVLADGLAAEPQSFTATDDSLHEIVLTMRVSAVTESLVVSAAHVDLPLSQAAASVTVVDGEEIAARQVRTLGDALRSVPGLSVAQSGTLASLTSLFTRGGESDYTLVLVDGMRANAFGGGLDLGQVPLVDAERIEVVRGPQSAVFGSDAIGGVVQIVTRRCDAGSGQRCGRVGGAVEAGSMATVRGRAAAAGGRATVSWRVNAEHAQSDGYTGPAPATGERVGNDDSRVQHAGASLGWHGGTGAEVRGQALFSSTERGFPGPYGSNPLGVYTAVDRISRGVTSRRQFGLLWTQPWGGAASRVRQRTDASVGEFDSDFTSPFGTSESDTRRLAFRTQADAAISTELGVSAGIEVLRERAGSTFITGTTFAPIPVRRLVAGYFGEARYAPASRLSLAGGIRLERIHRDALEGNPSAFSPRPNFAAETILSANPRIAVAYLLQGAGGSGPATRVRASAGSGIRPPDAFEIAFTDNPSLKPERSRSFDAGLQHTFDGGAATLEATAFFNAYDDLIVAVGRSFRDASRYRTDNISNARARGLELAASLRPLAALDVRGSYTLLDTEILAVDRGTEAPAPYRVGEQLIRRPRHSGSLTAAFAAPRFTLFGELQVRGPVRDIEPTLGASGGVFRAGGFAVLDIGGAYRVSRLLEVFARVENVADRFYEEAFGFPAPRRQATAGVRLAAGR